MRYLYFILIFFVIACAKAEKPKVTHKKLAKVSTNNILDTIKKPTYGLRKYNHVKNFYKTLAKPVTDLCINENVPPAAVLAMAGLESGWNRGYVGQITGNILSLGARKGDKELPALYLPTSKKSGDVVFDSLNLIKYLKKDLIWKKRPASLKKDYRPINIAGTKYQLAYLNYHPKAKSKAQIQNIKDFLNVFISHKSRILAYRSARQHLDSLVLKNGKEILLKENTVLYFINAISGRPNTFNYRKTWPKKVINILNNAGLVTLTNQLYNNKEFEQVW